MSDFEAALQQKLARNAELERQRREAEREMERWELRRAQEAEERERQLAVARRERHAELVEVLTTVANKLKAADPEGFVVRLGWSTSGEEFIAKMSTRVLEPARTLFIELDREDDEVLARWRTDIGSSLELWRLLEVDGDMLSELVLQLADQDYWRSATRPPPFPKPED
ncbi:MAG TPA: hypothetical protein VIK95_07525 [Egibacteraceae bacterium]